MTRLVPALLCVSAVFVCSSPAQAGPDFGYVYKADIEEPGETELTLWATHRGGKGEGHYDAQDYRIEVERGITERFQISGYANFAGHHIRGLSGEFDRVDRDLAFQGLSAEFKYQVRSPEKGRLGIARTGTASGLPCTRSPAGRESARSRASTRPNMSSSSRRFCRRTLRATAWSGRQM